ncbi:hypothetical protein TIFTF001_047160 [Ficus carica]|uniref:Uncharacterized protein n=1 Tax=Ficus carica TaxID=3494 RepID=A0AA87Z2J8_FICCA|nr:hypothetical protein TIFTF001_047160 [Ficus carica]
MDPDHVDADREAISSFYEAHPLSFDGTSRTISLGAWLYDMELVFRTGHIPGRLQVSLGSRCLTGDARIWWISVGEPQLPSRTWVHFRSLMVGQQEVPAHKAGEQEDVEGDPEAGDPEEDDIMVIPGDPPADPTIIDISSDEEDDIEDMPADPPADPIVIDISSDEEGDDEDMEQAPEPEQAGWLEDQEDFVDDPEEILFDDGDWETDSDVAT